MAGPAKGISKPELVAKPTGGVKQLTEIPWEYHGQWTQKPKFCGTDGWDEDSSIWVKASGAGYFESFREVASVTVASTGLKLHFKLLPSDPGESVFDPDELTDPPDVLTLSKDGQVLNGSYRKCPVKE